MFVSLFRHIQSVSQKISQPANKYLLSAYYMPVNKNRCGSCPKTYSFRGNGYSSNNCSLKCNIATKEKGTTVRFPCERHVPFSGRQETAALRSEFRFERGEGVKSVKGWGKGLPSWGNSWCKNPAVGRWWSLWRREWGREMYVMKPEAGRGYTTASLYPESKGGQLKGFKKITW